jgi:membrane associated rhomboid family serine protease
MKWKHALRPALMLVGLMWLFHLLQLATQEQWVHLGILPRHVEGVVGVFTAPLIHGSIQHLISNTFPMIFLMVVLGLAYPRSARYAFVFVYIGTGIGMWLFARSNYHIGASGVVYGLVAFLFWTGLFRRNMRSIALSLAILFLYSGYIWGIFPNKPGISWDGHLIGALVGVVVAYLLRNRIEPTKEPEYTFLEEEAPESYYFDRDIFDRNSRDPRE